MLRQAFDPTDVGWRLGRSRVPRGVELWCRYDRTTGVYGEQGSGKTLDLLAPALLAHRGAGLATLTKVDDLLLTATPGEISYSEKKVERVIEAYDAGASADLDTSETRVVADELIRRAQSTSARVTFIEDTTLLSDVGGVGALLRYQI